MKLITYMAIALLLIGCGDNPRQRASHYALACVNTAKANGVPVTIELIDLCQQGGARLNGLEKVDGNQHP